MTYDDEKDAFVTYKPDWTSPVVFNRELSLLHALDAFITVIQGFLNKIRKYSATLVTKVDRNHITSLI